MTSSNSGITDEQLFMTLTADLVTQAWVAMGKLKNPITDKLEPNLQASALLIDMLDMLSRKTEGNRSDEETQLLKDNLQQLKLNYVTEKQAADSAPAEEAPAVDAAEEGENPDSGSEGDDPSDETTKNASDS
ncbi:MAG: DUF1844 domain-containing protein [Candidatus Marinimicrobia bacterium]|nr:DUF1844 domain-containing protein [Candidatus Neomarinimicrobiota bacterium]